MSDEPETSDGKAHYVFRSGKLNKQQIEAAAARILDPDASAYEVLGVGHDASQAQIEASQRSLRIAFHPDKKNHVNATQIFQKVEEAFDTLQVEARRSSYDRSTQAMGGMRGGIGATLREGKYGRIADALSRLPGGFQLKLPEIIVVGVESSGKSSLMERLAMRSAFPRAESFCTRMPIRMKMLYRAHENRITIRCVHTDTGETAKYRPAGGEEELAEMRIECTSAYQDDVQNEVLQKIISEFIIQVHGRDDGKSVLTDIEIQIEIRACNVPDLELVDLPGIVSMPESVREQTRKLVQTYLSKPDTLVLCVISGSSDTLRGARILEEIETHSASSPAFSKTIVVQTKTDLLVDNPTKGLPSLERRLSDPYNELGCEPVALIPVINRCGDGISLPELVQAESQRFEEYCALQEGLRSFPLGIKDVLASLNGLFESHMRDVWVPQETSKLDKQKASEQQKLADLGKCLANTEIEVRTVLVRVQTVLRQVLQSTVFEPAKVGAKVSDSAWSAWPLVESQGSDSTGVSSTTRLCASLDRVHSQHQYRRNLQTLPAKLLIGTCLDKTFEDDVKPLRINRLATMRIHLGTWFQFKAQTWVETMSRAPLRLDLSCSNVRDKLIDTAFDSILVPMLHALSSDEIVTYLLGKPNWVDEGPDDARVRNTLTTRIHDIDVARKALADVATAASAGEEEV